MRRCGETATLPTNMEVERGPFETTILHLWPNLGFHVDLGEGTTISSREKVMTGMILPLCYLGDQIKY